ncbi:MAG: hypothetical protein L0271_16660, partial [Gemmatimonadetes bacterium]|nr:hypothetical protein [Gemmatimonadota bacterium]
RIRNPQSEIRNENLVRDSYLAPTPAGIPSGAPRERIPAKEGARKDSRTSDSRTSASVPPCLRGDASS